MRLAGRVVVRKWPRSVQRRQARGEEEEWKEKGEVDEEDEEEEEETKLGQQ